MTLRHIDELVDLIPAPRCPQCGASLLLNFRTQALWCSLIGCTYGVLAPVYWDGGRIAYEPPIAPAPGEETP